MLAFALLISGCSSAPAAQDFPEPPAKVERVTVAWSNVTYVHECYVPIDPCFLTDGVTPEPYALRGIGAGLLVNVTWTPDEDGSAELVLIVRFDNADPVQVRGTSPLQVHVPRPEADSATVEVQPPPVAEAPMFPSGTAQHYVVVASYFPTPA